MVKVEMKEHCEKGNESLADQGGMDPDREKWKGLFEM